MLEKWMRGLDISHHNRITPERIKSAGFDFVILKATEGLGWRDNAFDDMYLDIKSWNNCHPDDPIHIGCYHYFRATDIDGALAEADYFLESIKELCFDMPVFVDVEEAETFRSPTARKAVISFLERVESAGYWAGFYTYDWRVRAGKEFDGLCNRFTAWVAAIDGAKPSCDAPIHQFTHTWAIDGKNFDANDCYYDFPRMIREYGLNGYKRKNSRADVNGDGKVNSKDLIAEMKAISAKSKDEKYDVNGDGKVDTKDLTRIMKEVNNK